jgi:hypothetical protein
MGLGYSNDLRIRVVRFVEKGAAARAAARQFEIGDSTAIRCETLPGNRQRCGEADHGSQPIAAQAP